ncbi:MAG: hypothetical protein GX542_08490 [Rhodococcus sp.]|nr:hypothetical protein [Rhodococcus sp. (in: high G+C Gram-positive bacteria)]
MVTSLRRFLSGLLLVAVAVLVPTAIVAEYIRGVVLETDSYTRTMTELADDPTIQDAVIDRTTGWIVSTPQGSSIPEPVVRHGVDSLVRSERFHDLWWRANRAAHPAAVALLTGDTRFVQLDDDGTIAVPLGDIVAESRDELIAQGVAGARMIPEAPAGDVTVVLVQAPELGKAQTVVRWLNDWAQLLTGLAGLAMTGAVLIAIRGTRRRAIASIGFGVALMSVVFLAVGFLFRRIYVQDVRGGSSLTRDVASAAVDVLVGPLVFDLWLAVALGIAVGLIAWLVGKTFRRKQSWTPEPVSSTPAEPPSPPAPDGDGESKDPSPTP